MPGQVPDPAPMSGTLLVGQALDEARWGGFQKLVLALAACAVVFDGLDNQLLGFAAPALIRDWHLAKADLVPIIAGSLIAMTVGTAIAGFVADRVGRRPTLIASVALFGLASASIALAPDLTVLFVLRLVAALGLGGAMPTATALIAEFTPRRHRSFGVTLGIVCVPLGGLLGGLIATAVLPAYGWRALFAIGGGLPLVAAAVFLILLPESPQHLVARGHDVRARRLLRRCAVPVDAQTVLAVHHPAAAAPHAGVRALFAPGLARDTPLIWAAFFFCLVAVYSVFNWAPALLADRGLSLTAASGGLAAFNLGGIAGALACGWLIDRFGSRLPLAGVAAAATLAALVGVASPPGSGTAPMAVIALFAVLGFTINGMQTTLFALAASLYPANVRATGVGMALGVGRLGAVLSSAAGAAAIARGGGAYFGLLAFSMAGALAAVLLLRRHSRPDPA